MATLDSRNPAHSRALADSEKAGVPAGEEPLLHDDTVLDLRMPSRRGLTIDERRSIVFRQSKDYPELSIYDVEPRKLEAALTDRSRLESLTRGQAPGTDSRIVVWHRDRLSATGYSPIDREAWQQLAFDPQTLARTTAELTRALSLALEFFGWKNTAPVLVVEQDDMVTKRRGYDTTLSVTMKKDVGPLAAAIESGIEDDVVAYRSIIASTFVHRLAHMERGEQGVNAAEEISPYLAQYLFDPKRNRIFAYEAAAATDQYRKVRFGIPPATISAGLTDIEAEGCHRALLFVARVVRADNTLLEHELASDRCPAKSNALARMGDLLTETQLKLLRGPIVLATLRMDNEKLMAASESMLTGRI